MENTSEPDVTVDDRVVNRSDNYDGDVETVLPSVEELFDDGKLNPGNERGDSERSGESGASRLDSGKVYEEDELDHPFDDPVVGSRNDELNPY